MKTNPIINAYLDLEKRREITLINELDEKFALWLAEFEKDNSRDTIVMQACVKFGNDQAKFDITPGDGVEKAANYFRNVIAFEKASCIGYLDSSFENLIREYHGEPDVIDGVIKFQVFLKKKFGKVAFQGTLNIVKDILEGRNPAITMFAV